MEYALNDPAYEVERQEVLLQIETAVAGNEKQVLDLYGMSGIGKSFLCREAFVRFEQKYSVVLTDFDEPEYNNIPHIVDRIISSLGISYFSQSDSLLKQYYDSVDASKNEILEKCVRNLVEEINIFAAQKKTILIFDTYEALPVEIQDNAFTTIMDGIQTNITVIIAGIEKVDSNFVTKAIHVQGFEVNEIQKYFIARTKRFKKIFKVQGNLEANEIQKATDGGHPIICGLLSDYLQHHADVTDVDSITRVLTQMVDEDPENRKEHLVSWISTLPDEVKTTVRLTAFFNEHMTPDMLSRISGMDTLKCKRAIEESSKFSFIKSSYSAGQSAVIQITMHQIAVDMVRKYYPYAAEELAEFTKRAVEEYDHLIEQDMTRSPAVRQQATLRVGRAMCMVRNGSFEEAIVMLDDEVLTALESFDYSMMTQLTSTVAHWYRQNKATADPRWEYVLSLFRGEVLLNQYKAEDALELVEQLQKSEYYQNPHLAAMTDSYHGRLLVNPCTVDVDDALMKAINLLTDSYSKLEEHGFAYRAVKTALWLGIAYTRKGNNEYANDVFHYARENCRNKLQEISIILEISKMIRLEQNVGESDVYMKECYRIMDGELKQKNKGKFYYYQGNVYRDLGRFDDAVEYYERAFEELKQRDDEFTLCELNLDYAWLEYLRKEDYDREKILKYLNIGWEMAEQYKFGTEYSEYYHMMYELKHYEKKYDESYDDLGKALIYAYQYNNVYMILDCLNHKAQMYYEKGDYDKIQSVLDEMQRILENGCRIRVFNGRAMLVKADVHYLRKEYQDALQQYLEGFLIVALYGNSYSNVELFGELVEKRKEKMTSCLQHVVQRDAIIEAFKTKWMESNISEEFNFFIGDEGFGEH